MRKALAFVFLFSSLLIARTTVSGHHKFSGGGGIGNPTPPPSSTLFSDTFVSGSYSAWDFHSASDVDVIADPTGGGGNVGRIHYHICGLNNGTCGGSHQDTNRWFAKSFNSGNGYPNGLTYVVIQFDIYFKAPEVGGSQNIQRKVLYLQAPSGPGGTPNHYYALLLDTFAGSWSANLPTMTVSCEAILLTGQPGCGSSKQYWSSPYFNFNYNQWYTAKYELKVNTGDNSDGYVNVFVGGVKILGVTGMKLKPSSYTSGITNFQIGDQADRTNYLPVDEYRYFKNITFKTGL